MAPRQLKAIAYTELDPSAGRLRRPGVAVIA